MNAVIPGPWAKAETGKRSEHQCHVRIGVLDHTIVISSNCSEGQYRPPFEACCISHRQLDRIFPELEIADGGIGPVALVKLSAVGPDSWVQPNVREGTTARE